MVAFTVNGQRREVAVGPDAPLLWVLREHLGMTGTKFGCGIAACGACTVHIDGVPTRTCVRPISTIEPTAKIVTIEGLSPGSNHPVQQAWLAEDVPQCGYCQSGQIMSAVDLLNKNPRPSRDEIVEHMSAHICRCGTYPRIVRAIERAAREG